jgi:chemotaxis protein MotB
VSRDDPSEGALVYPKMPVPKRESDPRVSRSMKGGGVNKKLIALCAGAAVGGGALGFVARGGGDSGKLKDDIAELEKKQAASKERADEAEKERDVAQKSRSEAEAKLKDAMASQKDLADKVADNDKKAKDTAAAQAKLKGAIDKSSGSVSAEGDEIHLKLVDRVLFKIGDDQLTDSGKKVLDKVALALKDLPDKQIWVQGHTDDQPIYVAPKAPPKGPPPKKGPSGVGPPVQPVRFITNWELSAARALTVVHYLQDSAKIDPRRLAAVAFSQYHPISRDKAMNRRIELVLAPRKEVLQK